MGCESKLGVLRLQGVDPGTSSRKRWSLYAFVNLQPSAENKNLAVFLVFD